MEISAGLRSRWLTANAQEYGENYAQLSFPDASRAARATRQRAALLDALEGRIAIGCDGTKLDVSRLAPGCRICAAGGWSCLFITGRCNCRCFYCPTAQTDNDVPTTNTVPFRTPAEYVGYLERFGFQGASISGGEPLLSFKRSLAFVRAVKNHFGGAMHVWLYTNGTLADRDKLRQLRDAGLDEIRFDIGATGYRLDHLILAAGVIPTVTVEIPAIPEDLPLLKSKLGEMRDAGVAHLNLHQLRLTPFNFRHLASRGYTFLHGEKVTVLDSELAALELLRYSIDARLGPPVHYCSFVYKNRFQSRAARLRNAPFIVKGCESLTDNGYIRTLTLHGSPEAVTRQIGRFEDSGADDGLWSRGGSRQRLLMHPRLLDQVAWESFDLSVGYATTRQLPSVSYQNPFVSVPVADGKAVVVERVRVAPDFELGADARRLFMAVFLQGPGLSGDGAGDPRLEAIRPFENGMHGLQVYL